MTKSTEAQASPRFVRAYIDTLLWATFDDDGEPLEDNYGVASIAPETMQRIQDDCSRFWAMVESAGIDLDNELLVDGDATEQAAHDFWLTRNGHGAGFWDGDWAQDVEDRLTDIAQAFGEVWPYVGDDGRVHI